MISKAEKFLFVDIVKTGGTSINDLLKAMGGKGKHHSISRELPNLGVNKGLDSPITDEIIKTYFKFSIVRNPYDRLASIFSYCQSAPLQLRFQSAGWDGVLGRPIKHVPRKSLDRKTYWPTDFKVFVEWLVDYDEYYSDWTLEKYITMADWVRDDKGVMQLDYVGKYETLQTDLNAILKKLGSAPLEIPKLNVSQEAFKRIAIDDLACNKKLRALVADYYQDDFELFDYPIKIG